MYALGIDIGTTYTAAATWRNGRAEVFPLADKAAAIPSVVLVLDSKSVLVGEAAQRRALSEPHRVARGFKRRLGDSVPIMLGSQPYSPQALAAELLRAVLDQVQMREGRPPVRICLTHPANWGRFKRDMMREVVRLAGVILQVELTTEPEAAAAFYAHEKRIDEGSVVAVYDLGGGTFDATVLRKRAAGFEILGKPEGIEQLGGIDVDAAVFAHVAGTLGDNFASLDDEDPAVLAAVSRLRQECVAAKEALSADTDVTIPVLLPGLATEVRLTRAELEAMVRPMLYGTIEALRRTLDSARVSAADLHSVLLVGGSSRIPLVAQLIGAELGRPVAVDAHPKHAVALGAARLAGTVIEPTRQHAVPVLPARPVYRPRPPFTPPPPPAPPPPPPVTPPQPTGGRYRSRVPLLVAVVVLVAALIGGGVWWGVRAGWWASGGGDRDDLPTTTVTTSPPTTAELPASDRLSQLLDQDRPEVHQLFGRWVPQLSAKQDGMVVDGTTYDLDDVLANHADLRDRFDNVRLLWSSEYPVFRFGDFYVTVVGQPFDTPADANAWCDEHQFPADDCFAKLINGSGSWEQAAVYRN